MGVIHKEDGMKTLYQRWQSYQPSKEQTVWIAIACVVATLIIGFGFGGWVTGGTAQKVANEAAAGSHNQLAAAICAEQFMRAADARTRLAKLQALEWWERDDLVAAGGWATMPGEKEANSAVAQMCATRLAEEAKV
jgi:alpha/beta superfamily hydrolase